MATRDAPARIAVRRPMNDHRTMTIKLCATNETRHLCEYATPEIRRRLAALPPEAELLLSMSRIGVRANVWRAVDIVETPSVDAAGTEPEEPMRQSL